MKRISNITVARRLYNEGIKIIVVPCKCAPDSMFAVGIAKQIDYDDGSFDRLCNSIRYYNCCNELGRYLHFYK